MTREEEADKALRHTVFAPGVIPTLIGTLLLCIFLVPLLQILTDRHQGKPLQIRGFFRLLPTKAKLARTPGRKRKLAALLPDPEQIRTFDEDLEQNSFLSATLLPPTQLFLATRLGAGNKNVLVGREGWLHYYYDVEFLMKASFLLDPAGEKVITDQIEGIERQLTARGIRLVLAPVPPKTVFYPETMSTRFSGDVPLQSASLRRIEDSLRRDGIMVFDIVPFLAERKRRDARPLWLATDSHWTPEGMDCAAQALAGFIQQNVPLPPLPSAGLTLRPIKITLRGDLCNLLHLPRGASAYKDLPLVEDSVRTRDGRPFDLRQDADVLIIGDSLSEYYDGDSASFVHHLGYHLGRPVDRIIDPTKLHAPMVYAAQEIAAHPERLRGKRLIIWEFQARWLNFDAYEAWRPLDLHLLADAGPISARRQ